MDKATESKALKTVSRMIRKGFSPQDIRIIGRYYLEKAEDMNRNGTYLAFVEAIWDKLDVSQEQLLEVLVQVDATVEELASSDDYGKAFSEQASRTFEKTGVVISRYADGTPTHMEEINELEVRVPSTFE